MDKSLSARTPPTAVVRRADVWARRQSARPACVRRSSARRITHPGFDREIREPSGADREGSFFLAIRQSLPSTGKSVEARDNRAVEPAAAIIRFEISRGRRSTGGPLSCKQAISVRFRSSPPFAAIAQWQSSALPTRRCAVRFRLAAPIGRRLWRAGAPYKRARLGGLPGTGGIVTHGGYQFCGKAKGLLSLISSDGTGQYRLPQPNSMPSWRSWCARPVEGGEDAVRFGGSARGYRPKVGLQASKLAMTGSSPATRSNFILHGPYWQGSETVNLVVRGSNPRWRANNTGAARFATRVSKTRRRGFDTFRRCQYVPRAS